MPGVNFYPPPRCTKSVVKNRAPIRVKVDKSYSSILPVIIGVPQGSVLGPILFILYVNRICTLAPVGVTIKLFADDTKLYTVFTDRIPVMYLQSCLTAIFDWSKHWQMKLYPSKCSVMHIKTKAQCPINNQFVHSEPEKTWQFIFEYNFG